MSDLKDTIYFTWGCISLAKESYADTPKLKKAKYNPMVYAECWRAKNTSEWH